MSSKDTRRGFLKTGAAAGLAAGLGLGPKRADAALEKMKERMKIVLSTFSKAIIIDPPDEATLKEIKEAGFNGVEINLMGKEDKVVTPEQAAETRKIAEKVGIRIHSVLRGWAEYNSDDPEKVKADQAYTIATMRAAQGYGADAVLLVPGKIGGMAMPDRGKFKVKFDPQSGHVTSVTAGSDLQYQEYIEAHNKAWDAFQVSIKELMPVAYQTGVVIALENVWNNLFLSPEYFAHFVDSFKSPFLVKAYFDVANHLVYGPPPEDWIRVLGHRIAKVHIKDYKLNPADGNEWPSLGEGSVDFPKVIAALRGVGYHGWLTIEGPCGSDHTECAKRLDEIISGT
jgi:hexulose-6-phosphate isomerase